MGRRVTAGQMLAMLESVDPDWPISFETRDGRVFAPRPVGDEVDYDEVMSEDGAWEVMIPLEREDG